MAILKKNFPILNMSCASCAAHIEKALKEKANIIDANVNFANTSATIEYESSKATPELLRQYVQQAGYDMIIDDAVNTEENREKLHTEKINKLKKKTFWATILSIPIVAIGMFFMDIPYANYIMWALATPVLFWCGKDFYVNAWNQLKHRTSNMDTLVALSTSVAFAFSIFNTLFPEFWTSRGLDGHVYFEAASVIIAFILLGKLLEEKAKSSTTTSIKKLIGLRPKTVTIIENGNTEKQISIEDVQKGNSIRVKPGEKIAVDGIVSDGDSYVDESMLSGEPVPILKTKGEQVYAGTINQKGSLTFVAQKIGSETMLSQIIKMVQDAQGSKAPVQKLVDKIAAIFVPTIIGIAILSFALWMVLGDHAFTYALLAFVTVLIIACPCALGLATPTAIMVGIGKSAEKGILIKDAESLEMAKKVNAIVLDKTGTITQGKPEVENVVWHKNDDSKKDILFSIESRSEHPLAEAVVKHFNHSKSIEIKDFENRMGEGVKAKVENTVYLVGNKRFLESNNITIPNELIEKSNEYEKQAMTEIWFSDSNTALALIAVSDKIKDSSAEAIRLLQSSGIEVYMLTGDNAASAKATADKVGIKNYKAGLLPDEKDSFIKQLQHDGKIVAMVGDGINDSVALATADVSIAMGKGSDIAMDVAKIVIVSSDLTKIPLSIKISKQTVRTIKQNLFWAFIYNLIGIPIAAGILYPINGFLLNPMLAGGAMALSSVSVVTNSLLLKWKK